MPAERALRSVGTTAVREVFERNTCAWGLSLRRGLVVSVLPLAVTALVFATGASFALFDFLTRENSVFEWLQVALLLGAGTLFASVAARSWTRREYAAALAYTLATVATVFVAGEELSWGQSLLDWETPQGFRDRNFQGETNIHNITSAHSTFVYGVMLVALYGTLAPFVGAAREGPLGPLGALLLPPLCLVPAFLVPFVYRATRLALRPEDILPRYAFQIVELSELAELSLYFGTFALALLTRRRFVARA